MQDQPALYIDLGAFPGLRTRDVLADVLLPAEETPVSSFFHITSTRKLDDGRQCGSGH